MKMDAKKLKEAFAPVAVVAGEGSIRVEIENGMLTAICTDEAKVQLIKMSMGVISEPLGTFHVDAEKLMSALNDIEDGGEVEMSLRGNILLFEGKNCYRSIMLLAEGSNPKEPAIKYDYYAEVNVSFLSRINRIKDLSEFVTIRQYNDVLSIEASSDTEEAKYSMSVESTYNVCTCYPADMLSLLVKTIKTVDSVELMFESNYPLNLQWSNNGPLFEYYVAPRIES